MLKGLSRRIFGWVLPGQRTGQSAPQPRVRGPLIHVIILDGTMSSLEPGRETNAGITYRLLSNMGAQLSLYYEAGVQWEDWRSTPDVMMGRGINRQIRRAYGYLAGRYRPGDKVFLMGYSRGAYAVRSLAGVIDSVGLLRPEHAIERNITLAYRHYQSSPGSDAARAFARSYCQPKVEIEMVGVWDTVKSLGLRLPILWQWSEAQHSFHNHALGPSVKHGFHALALNETREVFEPVMWDSDQSHASTMEQVWFRGSHGDVGGQIGDFTPARPLANIPLVWMLDRAESCGLPLPTGWRSLFPCDPDAPSVGTWRDWGKMFILRRSRTVGKDPSEHLHPTAQRAENAPVLSRTA